ncbi:MAG TPA: hypothetical protein VF062_05865 [Candidatus Limnocylindrales bacterium]
MIDVVENSPHQIVVESVTGSLHMEKGHDNFDAEIRVLVANKSSRDTARRVAAARERQALNGQYGGGGALRVLPGCTCRGQRREGGGGGDRGGVVG